MSVRKISELPYLPIQEVQRQKSTQLKDSLLEISWSKIPNPVSSFWFESKYFKYGQMVSSIIEQVTGSEEYSVSVEFYNQAYFHNPVYMYNSLELSGNFYVNKDVSHRDILNNQYQINLRAYNNIISSLNDISAMADKDIYIDAKRNVYIRGGDRTNLGLGPWIVINENGKNGRPDISVNAPTNVNAPINIASSMYVTGQAVFTQDISGTAMHARWSDLAEGYRSDAKYEPGTFVMFGGKEEITIAVGQANAVITTRPGFVLGSGDRDESFQDIVLVGRSPVKVVGNVKKFDKLVLSDIPGVAKPQTDLTQKVIARALEDSPEGQDGNVHLVEAILRLDL